MNVLPKTGEGSSQEVPHIPWRPSLLDLPNEILVPFLEFFGVEALKILRLMNRRLHAAAQKCKTKHFKHWTLCSKIPAGRFRLFVEQVLIIKGLKLEKRKLAIAAKDSLFISDKDIQSLVEMHPELEFVSITCEHVSLSNSGLQALVSLKNLKLLDLELTGSAITGEGITHTPNAARLKTLNLTDSRKLTNEGIKNVLGICGESIEILDLSGTRGVSVLDVPLPKLKELKLSYVNLVGLGQLLSSIAHNLTVLDLSGTQITGEEFTTPLLNLKSLNLRACPILTSLDLKIFGSNLRILDLFGTQQVPFSEKVSLIKNQTLLEDLDMDFYWFVTGDHDDHLSDMLKTSGAKLKVLHVGSEEMTGKCFPSIKDYISNLEELDICAFELSESNFNFLMQTVGPSVKKLNMDCAGFTGSQLDLSNITLSQIEYLEFNCWQFFTDAAVSQIIGHCGPNLKKLVVNGSPFSGDLLSQYSATFPLLESIEVSGNSSFQMMTTTGLCALFRMAGTSLKNVEIEYASFTGEGLSEFSSALTNLESLTFGFCPFNDTGFLELFSHDKSNVLSLNLADTNLSGVGLVKSSVLFPQIQNLNLNTPPERSHLTEDGLTAILAMCGPSLRTIDVQPDLISDQTRASLKLRGVTVKLFDE